MDLCDAMPARRQGYLCLASMMESAAADLHNDNKPASLYLHLWTGTVKENELEHVAVSNSAMTGCITSPIVCQSAHTTVYTTVPGVCGLLMDPVSCETTTIMNNNSNKNNNTQYRSKSILSQQGSDT